MVHTQELVCTPELGVLQKKQKAKNRISLCRSIQSTILPVLIFACLLSNCGTSPTPETFKNRSRERDALCGAARAKQALHSAALPIGRLTAASPWLLEAAFFSSMSRAPRRSPRTPALPAAPHTSAHQRAPHDIEARALIVGPAAMCRRHSARSRAQVRSCRVRMCRPLEQRSSASADVFGRPGSRRPGRGAGP